MTDPSTAPVEQVAAMDEDIAHRIICEFRPEGWPAKEAETARLIANHRLATTATLQARVEDLERALAIAKDDVCKAYCAYSEYDDQNAHEHCADCKTITAALSTTPATSRLAELEARCASAEIAMSEVEAERDEAADRAGAMEAENARLREYIADQITHVETRIQDGIEMGATVWRLALEDVARESRVTLQQKGPSNG